MVASMQQHRLAGFKSTSLFRPPPLDSMEKQSKILQYVELFGQFACDTFANDIAELVCDHYPCQESQLVDDVLAAFVLYHPEHGHTVLHPLVSCLKDGTLTYSISTPPFGSFVSLFTISTASDLTEQWRLACGEVLRQLTKEYLVVYTGNNSSLGKRKASCKDAAPEETNRLWIPWITDSLLAASTVTRTDYFRWCGGLLQKYAGGGGFQTALDHGKHLQPLSPSAVPIGVAVVLAVCEDEVARYKTSELTAAAVEALLLPPSNVSDEQPVAVTPPLEPYACLFYRFYSTAAPFATQRLLLGLLGAATSSVSGGVDAAIRLLEILQAAEDSASGLKLPENWFHLHFLQPLGVAMKEGIAPGAVAALLFRMFSQPSVLFPRPRLEVMGSAYFQALAEGLASFFRDYGTDVESRICALLEAAYGLHPSDSSVGVTALVQPPVLSWNLFWPLERILEHLPRGTPSEACLRRIFAATVTATLERISPKNSGSCIDGLAELRGMFHCLFTDVSVSPPLGSLLISDALQVCLTNDKHKDLDNRQCVKESRGAVPTFDSYLVTTISGLACEVHLSSFLTSLSDVSSSAIQARKFLLVLEALLTVQPSTPGCGSETSNSVSAGEVAAHICGRLRNSRACTHSLKAMGRYKEMGEVGTRVAKLLALAN